MRTFTINPTPSNATVTINNQTTKSVTVIEGTSISWSVSASGYSAQSGSLTLIDDTTKDVVLVECAYTANQVIFEKSTAGTYSVELLETGNYEVYAIGGGGGGSNYREDNLYGYAGGGSGAGFIGVITLSKAVHSVIVGAGGAGNNGYFGSSSKVGGTGGNSSISNSVTCYGGGGAEAYDTGNTTVGAGGSKPTVNVPIISTTLNTAGNSGSRHHNGGSGNTANGGASVYNGYGAGGKSAKTSASGTAGYVKIVWKG